MSWVQWREEVWPVTADEASLSLHLWPENAGCPRQGWSLSLFHSIKPVERADGSEKESYLSVEVTNLHLRLSDWREIAACEIRADAAWHDAHQYTHEYGALEDAKVRLSRVTLIHTGPKLERKVETRSENALGHDFALRFGGRDGYLLPFELEAWLLPEDQYYRRSPETPEELAAFGKGPPNLRVVTPVRLDQLSCKIPPARDPAPLARAALRAEVGFDEPGWKSHVSWSSRRQENGEYEQVPGSASNVYFRQATS